MGTVGPPRVLATGAAFTSANGAIPVPTKRRAWFAARKECMQGAPLALPLRSGSFDHAVRTTAGAAAHMRGYAERTGAARAADHRCAPLPRKDE